ncbi:MAG: hypothetical protein ACQEP8_05340 [Chlamydiota bacterium]
MLSILGLVLIAIAWLLQFWNIQNNNYKVMPEFLFCYAIGVILLVISEFYSKLFIQGSLNLIIFLAVGLSWVKISGYLNGKPHK